MQERVACVLVIGDHPALASLPSALAALNLEVVCTDRLHEIGWALRGWSGACVAVLDASLPDGDAFVAIHRRLHQAPATPTVVVFDERYTVSPRELAPCDGIAHLPLTTDELVAKVVALLRRLGIEVAPLAPTEPTPPLPAGEASLVPASVPAASAPPLPAVEASPSGVPVPAAPPLPGEPRGEAIAVLSLKGGVGRSTIAANLAVALARWHGKRVILVDADLWRGDLGVLLDLPLGRGLATLVPPPDAVLEPEAVQAALLEHSSGVRLLPAPADPTLVESIPPLLPARLVALCKELADYVIVDTAPALDDLTLHVLGVADRVLGVLVPEVSAARHASRLLHLAPRLGLEERLLLVLNRANSGLNDQQLEELLGRPVDARLVSAGWKVLRAANRGVTLVDGDPARADGIMRDLARLAALIAGEPAPAEAPAAARRKLGWRLPRLWRGSRSAERGRLEPQVGAPPGSGGQ